MVPMIILGMFACINSNLIYLEKILMKSYIIIVFFIILLYF